MLPTSLAIAWTFWQRHRWGLVLLLGYLVAAAVSAVLPAHVTPAVAPSIFGPMSLPLLLVLLYLMAVFSYGFDASDVTSRESCFPASLFTLPVRTGALIGWPMFFGAAAVAVLWLITVWFILGPWLKHIGTAALPLGWPAMLAVASLAWLQALLWSPFGLPGLRIVLVIVLIVGMTAVPQVSAASGASEGFLVGLFAALAVTGWAVGYAGVRQARRGDVPDWEGILWPFRQLARGLPRRRQPFASAARAQLWFEWRRTGKSLPLMTGLVLPFALLPLAFGKNDVLPTAQTLLGTLALPVFLAAVWGTTVSGKNRWVKDHFGVAPHTATLPMTTAGLVGAQLKAAALSTVAAWALVSVAIPVAVLLSGNLDEVLGWWRHAIEEHQPAKVVAGIIAAAILLVLWTWKNLVNSRFVGLTGRKWIIQTSVLAGLTGFVVLCFVASWIHRHPETHDTVRALLPWLLGLLVVCRLAAAGWLLRRSLERSLLTPRTVLLWVASWLLLASILFGLLAWVVPAEFASAHYLAFGVLLALPTVRLAGTPLALAWNRHR